MGEPVRGADHELVEGVALVERARRPGGERLVGGWGTERARRRQRLGERQWRRGRFPGARVADVGLDQQLELHRLTGHVADGVGEHAGVARADALGRQGARDRQHQHVVRELDRANAVEPRRPGCRREFAESGCALIPDFVGRHGAPLSSVHRSVHRCGDR